MATKPVLYMLGVLLTVFVAMIENKGFCGKRLVNGNWESYGDCDDKTTSSVLKELDAKSNFDTLRGKEWHKASDGHCYKLFKEKLTFENAFDNCRRQLDNNATLAIGIRNLTIRSEITETLHLTPNNKPRQIWIGFKQAKSDKNWYWTDNKTMTGTEGEEGWRYGEPNHDLNEDCGALDSYHEFHFADFDCTGTGYYASLRKVTTDQLSTAGGNLSILYRNIIL